MTAAGDRGRGGWLRVMNGRGGAQSGLEDEMVGVGQEGVQASGKADEGVEGAGARTAVIISGGSGEGQGGV